MRRLRSDRRTSEIPIIFLTEKRERSDRLQGFEVGADDYITKPFDVQELRLRVRNALKRVSQGSLTNPVSGLPEGPLVEGMHDRIAADPKLEGITVIGRSGEFEARKGYGKHHAHPAHWSELLKSSPEMSCLRLCLGHAGGESFWIGGRKEADWGLCVYQLCTTYPNVYCEFGIHGEIVNTKSRDAFVKQMTALILKSRQTPGCIDFASKVMYGSDWFMPMTRVGGRENISQRSRMPPSASTTTLEPTCPSTATSCIATRYAFWTPKSGPMTPGFHLRSG